MGYLVEGLELLICKVAYTKYDATWLVPWSNYTRNIPGGKGRLVRGADNLTTICEPIV
jgi:hypothetical protein